MTTAEIIAGCGLAVSVLGLLVVGVRGAAMHGAVVQRLTGLENWQTSKSIDRSEHDDHSHRIEKLEGQMRSMSDGMTQLQLTMERLLASSEGSQKLIDLKLENLGHKIGNLRQIVEGHLLPPPGRIVNRDDC